jgi:hypothetical protein
MESQIIKTIWLCQLDSSGVVQAFGDRAQQTVSIIVGNQTVVKNLPIQFNQGVNAQAFDRLHENAGVQCDFVNAATSVAQTRQPCEIRLLTDIVIPPQVAFEVRIDSTQGVYGTGAVVCALSGYGKIFSAGNTF